MNAVSKAIEAAEPVEEFDNHRNAPRPDPACLYGLVGEIARAGSETTEVNAYAIAAAAIAYLSVAVGRGPYLLVIESEFVNILHQGKRDGNTLSAALRNCWDGEPLKPATKTNRLWASHPHVGLLAAITPSELLSSIAGRDLTNGFAIIKATAPNARDFTNRRVRKPDGEDEVERSRNRTKSRTRARVEHPFLVLKRLWGFAKVRYKGLAKNANCAFTALAMVNLYLAARRVPAVVRP